MEAQKQTSVKAIGIIISIFSGFIIFSNVMGAFAFSFLGIDEDLNGQKDRGEFSFFKFLLENYVYMCFIMMIIGIFYLVGGLNIRKYKLWANKLVTYLSILLIIIIFTLMILIVSTIGAEEDLIIFGAAALFTALLWSAPLGILIWFLNRPAIKEHFV